MRRYAAVIALALLAFAASGARGQDLARWQRQARSVTIVRDDWGIAHIHGHTDADAVFGMVYAQAEDDFNRVETNYLDALGWLAQAEGEGQVWHDLRARLYADPDSLKALYRASPAWLKPLMNAFADGLNYYLAVHPDVHPRVITRFEPWMALAFSEGSIGPDIETIGLGPLQQFYGSATPGAPATERPRPVEPGGSNGMALAPSRTATGHALFLINPHTSFFFRSELQMSSDQGLNAYGAVTWGQFFIYQGFNDRLGWMHTSSGVDAIDEFRETVVMRDGRPYYRVGDAERPMTRRAIAVSFRTADGMRTRPFTVYGTRHGPIVRQDGEHWVSVSIMHRPVQQLVESFTRTKARNLAAFRRSLDLQANSSNNTVYADADGNIAYWQANFIPRRDTSFDWTQPVDGSVPSAEWHGMLTVDEVPRAVNPPSGWVYNSNDPPWMAAGPDSPRREDYPRYVESQSSQSARGLHVSRVLTRSHAATLDSLIAGAYDSQLPWFEQPLPALLRAWDALPDSDSLKSRLREQVGMLRAWDMRWGVASVPTTLAIFWGENISRRVARAARGTGMLAEDYIAQRGDGREMLQALAAASDTITARFGTWRTPWGDINRFQRLTDDIVHPFNDAGPSIPVGFTGGQWGSIAAFAARAYPNTRKRYGTSGNSFVAVVEFGRDSVRARAVTAGGESGDVRSRHFNDQAERYTTGNLRDVYFYRSQLRGHIEREYHPGE